MRDWTDEDAISVIRDIIIDLAPEPPINRHGDLDLVDDLGYFSLALLEMAFTLEDEFQLPPIDQESAAGIRTVGDVERYILVQLRVHGRAEASSAEA